MPSSDLFGGGLLQQPLSGCRYQTRKADLPCGHLWDSYLLQRKSWIRRLRQTPCLVLPSPNALLILAAASLTEWPSLYSKSILARTTFLSRIYFKYPLSIKKLESMLDISASIDSADIGLQIDMHTEHNCLSNAALKKTALKLSQNFLIDPVYHNTSFPRRKCGGWAHKY